MDNKEKTLKRLHDIEEIADWEALGRLDFDPGDARAADHTASGRTVYSCDRPGLAPGEMLKEYPDGRKEVVRFEGKENPKEIFLRAYAAPGQGG